VNAFLDALRETGATNMFGAVPYILQEFEGCREITKQQAKAMLAEWMRTFSERHPK
jgi:hypothetical protein